MENDWIKNAFDKAELGGIEVLEFKEIMKRMPAILLAYSMAVGPEKGLKVLSNVLGDENLLPLIFASYSAGYVDYQKEHKKDD